MLKKIITNLRRATEGLKGDSFSGPGREGRPGFEGEARKNGAFLGWREWWNNFNWESTKAEIDRESRARILLVGLPGAGKSTLLNRLCGWTVSPPHETQPAEEPTPPGWAGSTAEVEDFGLFCLIDLPAETGGYDEGLGWGLGFEAGNENGNGQGWGSDPIWVSSMEPWSLLEGADLLVYLIDGAVGVRPADYRWIGRLRRLGLPLLVALNKEDLLEAEALQRLPEIEQRLAASVLPISALKGASVPTRLVPAMVNACPNLAVALGRELGSFRREAAGRLIGRAAIINGFLALEPVPLIDLPFQIMNLVGLMLRLGAVYNRPPAAVYRREVTAAVAGGLVGRYAAQQAAKLVPVVGWIASGLIGISCTWLLGQAAVAYFEAGGNTAGFGELSRTVNRRWEQARQQLGQTWQPVQTGWRRWVVMPWGRRPRLQVR